MLLTIHPKFQPNVLGSLKWLAFADSDVRLATLAEVFIIRPGRDMAVDDKERLFTPQDVLKYLSGLVDVWDVWESDYVDGTDMGDEVAYMRLAHYSVKEYLTSSRITQGPATAFHFSEVDARLHIARAFIAYHFYRLAYESNDPHYIAGHPQWLHHLERVPRDFWTPGVIYDATRALTMQSRSLMKTFIREVFQTSKVDVAKHCSNPQWPHCCTALHGFPRITDMLLSGLPGTNQFLMQEHLDAALQDAVRGGSIAVVELLLAKGADINAETAKHGDAMKAAITNRDREFSPRGQEEMMRLLLDRGFHLNAQRGQPGVAPAGPDGSSGTDWENAVAGTALYKAAVCGSNVACRLLLDEGADVNAGGGIYGSPLQAAISRWPGGYKDMTLMRDLILLLLDREADVNA